MFTIKFTVPVPRKIHNNNLLRFFSRKVSCEKPRNTKKLTIPPECTEYQDSCDKRQEPPPKPVSSKSDPKLNNCKVQSIVEDYGKLYEDVTKHADSKLKSFQDESKSILDELEKAVEAERKNEEVQLEELSRGIKEKIKELIVLDPSLATSKRNCSLSINHQVRQAVRNLQCDILPRETRLKQMLDCLERDLTVCIDRARKLLRSGRKCRDPQELAKYIEENGDYAKQIVDEAFDNANNRLSKIHLYRRDILNYHKTTVAEVTKENRERNEAFLKHLDNCIFAIKKNERR